MPPLHLLNTFRHILIGSSRPWLKQFTSNFIGRFRSRILLKLYNLQQQNGPNSVVQFRQQLSKRALRSRLDLLAKPANQGTVPGTLNNLISAIVQPHIVLSQPTIATIRRQPVFAPYHYSTPTGSRGCYHQSAPGLGWVLTLVGHRIARRHASPWPGVMIRSGLVERIPKARLFMSLCSIVFALIMIQSWCCCWLSHYPSTVDTLQTDTRRPVIT